MKLKERLSGRRDIPNGEYDQYAADFTQTYVGPNMPLEQFAVMHAGPTGMAFAMIFNEVPGESNPAKHFAEVLKRDDGIGDLTSTAGLAADIMSTFVYDDVIYENGAQVVLTNIALNSKMTEATKPTHWRFNFGRVDTSKKSMLFTESFDALSKKFAGDGVARDIGALSYIDAYEEVFDWVIGAMPDGDNSTWSNAANALMDAYYEGSEDTMTEKTSKKGKHTTESTKHMKESSDGWSDVADQTDLERVLNDLSQLQYEVKNCRRGAYTDCFTAQALSKYIERLATKLSDVADDIANIKEEDD